MGKVLSGIFGTSSDFRANTGGQNFGAAISQAQGQYGDALKDQQGLAGTLQMQAAGAGPNLGQALLRQATDRGVAQNAALIASAKGVNPALAQRLAAQNAATMNQEAAGQGAQIGIQQQLGAQGQLGNLYGQMAGQSLQSQGMAQNALNANNQVNAGIEMANTQSQNQMMGGLLGGAGAIGAGFATRKAHGGFIDGPEVVPGDDPANDVVPVAASAGEIVIPKSKASDPEKAKAFIDHLMGEKKSKKDDKPVTYADILQIKRKIDAISKKVGAK
jgi:hypothetical protein